MKPIFPIQALLICSLAAGVSAATSVPESPTTRTTTSHAASQPATAEAVVFRGKRPQFTLRVPKGFVRIIRRKFDPTDKDYLCHFARYDSDGNAIQLSLQRVAGEISHKIYTKETVEKEDVVEVYTQKWQGLDINVFVLRHDLASGVFLQFNVVVPLQVDALTVTLEGPESKDKEMRKLVGEVLAGLEGKSSWAGPKAGMFESFKHASLPLFIIGLVVVLIALKRHRILQARQGAGRVGDAETQSDRENAHKS